LAALVYAPDRNQPCGGTAAFYPIVGVETGLSPASRVPSDNGESLSSKDYVPNYVKRMLLLSVCIVAGVLAWFWLSTSSEMKWRLGALLRDVREHLPTRRSLTSPRADIYEYR
jgi:hypothetical protein